MPPGSSISTSAKTTGGVGIDSPSKPTPSALPHTKAFFGQDDPEKAIAEVAGIDDDEGRFERGLATLLDGVAKEDRARRPPTASRRTPVSGPKTLKS